MPSVKCLVPEHGRIDPEILLAQLQEAAIESRSFSPHVLEFITELSRRLRRHPRVREYPAIGALAWWIRPAGIQPLRRHWEDLCKDSKIIRAPRGTAFHIPPTNVDTMFVYSWLLSALVGNANLIRLAPRAVESPSPLLEVIAATLDDHPFMARTTAIVSYGHDEEITSTFSRADVRVIWGGDETIRAIRKIPVAPYTNELAFPDRYSIASFNSETVRTCSDSQLDELVTSFINDAYWFDQLACASPRLIVWCGRKDVVSSASVRFHQRLQEHLTIRNERVATSTIISKLVHLTSMAADGVLDAVDWSKNELTIGHLAGLSEFPRDSPGGGLFYEVQVNQLSDIHPYITRKDQTLTHFGYTQSELDNFAQSLGAKGLDRIVPVGQALSFSHHWDGLDLLSSFSREIHVQNDIQSPTVPSL